MTTLDFLNQTLVEAENSVAPYKVYVHRIIQDTKHPHITMTIVADGSYITSDGEAVSEMVVQFDVWHNSSQGECLQLYERLVAGLNALGFVRSRTFNLGRDSDWFRITSDWRKNRVPQDREVL
jgi:hypothetical protein